MKKMLLTSLCCMVNYTAFADDLSKQIFSEKAQELLRDYAPRSAGPMSHYPFIHPLHDKAKHYTEEYRPAWEELLFTCVTNGYENIIHPTTINGVVFALSEIASTNSIPMLVNVYTQLLEHNKNEDQKRQKEILNILLTINDSTALDAIFSLIDMTETKLGINFSTPLREMIINDLEKVQKKQERFEAYIIKNPNATIDEISLKEFEMANKRQERFNTYQNSNLSERNHVFLQQARSLKRAQEGQNSD